MYVTNNPEIFADPMGLQFECKGRKMADNPARLRLFPTDVGDGNHDITYRPRTIDNKSPKNDWYVFEHQANIPKNPIKVGEHDYVSPDVATAA